LTGLTVADLDGLRRAGEALLSKGTRAVLMKGGHLEGELVVDLLMWSGGERRFESARVPGPNTHGTGCTLASACAAGLAQGLELEAAVERAHGYTPRRSGVRPASDGATGP
jgi:hydroxymethylpyrimidine/phosphomethylpyrimidine kinase